MSTQLALITERTPCIVVMANYEDLESKDEETRKRVQEKLYNDAIPMLDLNLHHFVVIFDQEKAAFNKGIYYHRYYATLLCACRTLVYNSFFGGFILDSKTGIVTNMQEAQEQVKRCPYG